MKSMELEIFIDTCVVLALEACGESTVMEHPTITADLLPSSLRLIPQSPNVEGPEPDRSICTLYETRISGIAVEPFLEGNVLLLLSLQMNPKCL